jgi:hypothetical protein
MASDTTSILDLPTDPAGGGSIGGNISFSANEKINTNVNSGIPPSALTLDQTTINQIVSGLQQASTTGATQLPSRDIPRNIDGVTQDVQVQPNYIPQTSNKDYINDYENNADIINNYNRHAEYGNSLDQLYDELQIPLLISVLYFLFQLPVFKRYLYKFFPALFSKDGNHNIYGFLFTSVLFGLLYYLLAKITTHFSRF